MPDQPTFEGIKEWPEAPAPIGHNQPPLEMALLSELEDALVIKGLTRRIGEIIEAAGRAPPVEDEDSAGAVGDLVAQAKEAKKAVEAEREVLNRPLLNAQRALKGKAVSLTLPMEAAIEPLRVSLDAYVAENQDVKHGDMGARVGARETWDFEVADFAKLPLAIRRHPAVTEAIEKVIRGLIRGGERKIAGVKIWPVTKSTVR
jgi:hypothetical protein